MGQNTLSVKIVREANINYHVSEPRRPNQNPSEADIREVKKCLYRLMLKKRVPRHLWNFALRRICETGNFTVTSLHDAQGRTPLEIITSETPDISELFYFGFYDWVTFKSNGGAGGAEIGIWLGVSHRVGPLMSYWILPKSVIPISCTVETTAMSTSFRRWTTFRARKEKSNSTLALAQASELVAMFSCSLLLTTCFKLSIFDIFH